MHPPQSEKQSVKLRVNGKIVEHDVPADRTLLRFLREDLGLTGTKCGCEIGECGACTVLINNKPMCSCLVLVAALGDVEILTVEGLADGDNLITRSNIRKAQREYECIGPGTHTDYVTHANLFSKA